MSIANSTAGSVYRQSRTRKASAVILAVAEAAIRTALVTAKTRASRTGRHASWLVLLSAFALGCGSSGGNASARHRQVTTYYFNEIGSVDASADRLSQVDLVFYAFWGIDSSGHLLMMRPDLDLDGSAVTPPPEPITVAEAVARFPGSQGYLKQACELKVANPGVAFRPSVGGWGHGANFSPAFAAESGREAFAADTLALVLGMLCADNKPLFDGIDIDWEYPQVVVGGVAPAISPADGTNLHLAVRTARAVLGKQLAISLTVPHGDPGITVEEADSNDVPGDGGSIRNFFNAANGQLAPDNAEFVKAVSAFTIMGYDFMAFALETTPNAPMQLDPARGLPDIEAGLEALAEYGVPPEKILLGAPLYGRSIGATLAAGARCLQAEPTLANHGVGLALPDFTAKNPYGLQEPCSVNWILYNEIDVQKLGDGAFDSGLAGSDQVLAYWYGTDLSNNRAAEVLRPGSAALTALSQYTDLFMSFDSPKSIASKAQVIRELGLAGISFWEVSQDLPYNSGRIDIDGTSYPLSLIETAVEELE